MRFRFQTLEKYVQFPTVGKRYLRVRPMRKSKKNKRGQVMLEYVVSICIFMLLVGLSATLLYSFKIYGHRILIFMAGA